MVIVSVTKGGPKSGWQEVSRSAVNNFATCAHRSQSYSREEQKEPPFPLVRDLLCDLLCTCQPRRCHQAALPPPGEPGFRLSCQVDVCCSVPPPPPPHPTRANCHENHQRHHQCCGDRAKFVEKLSKSRRGAQISRHRPPPLPPPKKQRSLQVPPQVLPLP